MIDIPCENFLALASDGAICSVAVYLLWIYATSPALDYVTFVQV